MNGVAFRAYVEQVLVPTLAPGDIVLIDRRRRPVDPKRHAHWAEGSCLAIEQLGAGLRYLPSYSPDFNPIEMAFSKL